MAFDVNPVLSGRRLGLRPVKETDRDALYDAASDPLIWAGHPATTRHQRSVFDPYFDFLVAAGGALLATTTADNLVIGTSRFYAVPDQPGEFGIGFTFLRRSYWGGAWNRDMKGMMLSHGFQHLPRIWFHIAPDNIRSQTATTRLGAQFAYDADLDLGTGLAINRCYTLTPNDWEAAKP